MKGQLFIDNTDVYTQFGVSVTKGGYNDQLTFPDLREPDESLEAYKTAENYNKIANKIYPMSELTVLS